MIKGGTGGGNTTTGLRFEQRTDIRQIFENIEGYSIIESTNRTGYEIWFNHEKLAYCFKKRELYRFLEQEPYCVNWQEHLSKRLEPDNALFVIVRDTLFIIEIKFQQVSGSVDEKLQTCDFKRKQYSKLVRDLGWRVEYVYVLNDWFRDPVYRDTLDYIHSMNCHYLFNEVPLAWLGLPSR
ncbi:hypothetical protein [Kingella oralis]|jgi:hypothetical protein|uniref:Uncharacterized protein n=1 Tax=Kingella oralis ATCC 51147 TaxID=629741 RepID=C4GLX4_9NEIS|nr:hypothetical protein [Kingella oralis]EEP67125.1 hypothetical protein GCWU000324_02697 [Kingella oralis ATCC 51147]QMT42921.1 hypothetical protein H3L93_00660 [Kingella oralis]RKW27947.1 MAG: hypothetical protein D8B42_08235 [Kingella sp. (in: b-proteobacteria)]